MRVQWVSRNDRWEFMPGPLPFDEMTNADGSVREPYLILDQWLKEQPPEAMGGGVALAAFQKARAQAAASEVRVDEECADPRRVSGRVELAGIAIGARIAAE